MTAGPRQFPCRSCGATVRFAPGTDVLECPYCGSETRIEASTDAIVERDYRAAVAELDADGELVLDGRAAADADTEEVTSVRCGSCGALVEPSPSQEAFPCPYCGSSIVARELSQRLIKPQALLPFRIGRDRATELFRAWIRRLWFAPDALKEMARLEGRLQGLYSPYWTYDAGTVTRYTGERGEEYTVTRTRTVTRNGKQVTETYQEVKVRWYPASGTVARHFDDMLVVGSRSLPRGLAEELEPWDLDNLVGYTDEYLSGFLAERYQVDVREGWARARERMADVIRGDVRRDIGGDRQRIHSMDTAHRDVTYKHVLLPLWICSYRYKDDVYRFLVNARTGEVQGQRPWSWIKIGLTVLAVAAAAAALSVYCGG